MAYPEEYERLVDLTVAATDLLKAEGVKKLRLVTLEEALIMQAASNVLCSERYFRSVQVAEVTKLTIGTVQVINRRFEGVYHIITSQEPTGEPLKKAGRPPRLFTPTEFGERVFTLFSPELVFEKQFQEPSALL
jgi:hypothetical protein